MLKKINLKAYELSHIFGDSEDNIEINFGKISGDFWGKDILMVSAIVGKNGVGKSSILRYIKDKSSLRIDKDGHSNIIYYSPHLDYRDNYNFDVDANDISLDSVIRRDLESIFENEKESSENGWMINPKQDLEILNTARQMDFLNSEICTSHVVFGAIFKNLKFGFGEVTLRGLNISNFTDNNFHNTPLAFRKTILNIINKSRKEIAKWPEIRLATKNEKELNQHEINGYIFKRNLIISFLSIIIDFFENDAVYLSRGYIDRIDKDIDAFELFNNFIQEAKITELNSEKIYKNVFNDIVLELFNQIYKIVDEITDEKFISNKSFISNYENLELIKKLQNEILFHLSRNYFFEKTNIYSFLGIQSTSRKLSSGENALLNFYSVLYECIKNIEEKNSHDKYVILLDEADLGYHPQWKKRFVNSIVKSITAFFKFSKKQAKVQIIFTTHDPLTLSDIPSTNVVFLNRISTGHTIVTNKDKETFGANIHDLLADSFFIEDGLIGDFAKEKIDNTILWLRYKLLEKEIKEKEIKEKEIKEILEQNKWLKNSSKEFHKQIIDLVDEPILKYKLNEMYLNIFPLEIDKAEAKKRIIEIAKISGLNINIIES